MMRLSRVLVSVSFVLAASSAFAQETPTALAARKKLQQKITVDWKDITTKAIFEDIKSEMDKPPGFKIDTTTGMSLNTKLSYKAKDKSIEEVLNDLAEKFEFGWFVKSDGKDRYDGWIIIRKHKNKERGYEDGKEPKKKAEAAPLEGRQLLMHAVLTTPDLEPAVKRGLLWLALARKE